MCYRLGAKYVSLDWVLKMCDLLGAKNVLLPGCQKCAYFSGAKNVLNHRREIFRRQKCRVVKKNQAPKIQASNLLQSHACIKNICG